MALEGTWSTAEKVTGRTAITRYACWKKNRLALTLSALFCTVLLLSLLLGAVVYYSSDVPSIESPMALKNPCDTMYCPFGARCLLNEMSHLAYCQCQQTCSDFVSLVCGDDGVTYTNECQLQYASCTQQKRVIPVRKGTCDIQDPCSTMKCHPNARCQKSPDGRSAECICSPDCDEEHKSLGPRPVCGSDGRTYSSACNLNAASCQEGNLITVKFKGVCDPCDGVECQTFQACQLDESRNAICRCNSTCSPEFKPVCGSDGKTYVNECSLRVEACKSRRNIRIIFTGECTTGSNPCDNLQCGPSQGCDIDRHGIATCHCIESCDPIMRPVCGSDGETYDNECEMKRLACLQKRHLEVAYRGECGERGQCFRHHCSSGSTCVIIGGLPSCKCPTCSEEYQPVCGTDGASYINSCKLKREACEQKLEIAVAYLGVCNGCEGIRCEYYAICKSDDRGNGRCVCPHSCRETDDRVCGSDEVTYDNNCEMRVSACKMAKYVMVVSKGKCDLCQNVKCKYGARCEDGRCVCPIDCHNEFDPVCANDGITYSNECKMRQAACENNQDLNILFFGQCDDVAGPGQDPGSGLEGDCHSKSCKYGGECGYDEDGLPVCYCSFNCLTTLEPVCASDGKLYDNECKIKEESCFTQRSLMPVHIEMCEEIREVPCDGEIPLVDQSTGKDYFCGEGMGSKLCPPGSYCHKSSAFAKCCSEVILIKTCSESIFGCCSDGKSQAQGPNSAGCPSVCNCNRLGSYGVTCDPNSKQCSCKPGVGGPRCDRCDPGYWGLHKTEESSGCLPCSCNLYGSVRDDCEQMTGRCVCKHGIHGMKCDVCPKGTVLSPDGCVAMSIANPVKGSCETLECHHGAVCRADEEEVQCVCQFACPMDNSRHVVCGSDGNTYASECQMYLFSCRYQKTITVASRRSCTKVQRRRNIHPLDLRSQTEKLHSKLPKRIRRRNLRGHRFEKVRNTINTSSEDCFPFCKNTVLEVLSFDFKRHFIVDINMAIASKNGVIISVGNRQRRNTPYLTVALNNGYLECRFKNEKTIIILQLQARITLGKIHHISIDVGSIGSIIRLDGRRSHFDYPENFTFNLSGSIFIGAVPLLLQRYTANGDVRAGFSGCIYNISFDGIIFNFRNFSRNNYSAHFPLDIRINMPLESSNDALSTQCLNIRTMNALRTCLPPCIDNYSKAKYLIQSQHRKYRASEREKSRVTLLFRPKLQEGQLFLLTLNNSISSACWNVTLNHSTIVISIAHPASFPEVVAQFKEQDVHGKWSRITISCFESFLELTINGFYQRLNMPYLHFVRRTNNGINWILNISWPNDTVGVKFSDMNEQYHTASDSKNSVLTMNLS